MSTFNTPNSSDIVCHGAPVKRTELYRYTSQNQDQVNLFPAPAAATPPPSPRRNECGDPPKKRRKRNNFNYLGNILPNPFPQLGGNNN